MKKILTILALLLTFATGALAQNANRSGFFIEGGVGLPVGSLPVKGTRWENNTLYFLRPSGPDVNIAIGYRRATSRVFAWELKAEASTMPSSFSKATAFALMPGIRYTTKELFGNTSMYFGFNAGVALGQSNDYHSFDGSYNEITLNTPNEADFSYGDFDSFGGKINLSVGFNISSSFYVGLYWDFCYIANQYSFSIDEYDYTDYTNVRYNKDGNAVWGSAGVRLGVRF